MAIFLLEMDQNQRSSLSLQEQIGVQEIEKKRPMSLMDGPIDASFQFVEKLTLLNFSILR